MIVIILNVPNIIHAKIEAINNIIAVPINNKETKPPRIDAKKPVNLQSSTNPKIVKINPKGINLNMNFVNLKHNHN